MTDELLPAHHARKPMNPIPSPLAGTRRMAVALMTLLFQWVSVALAQPVVRWARTGGGESLSFCTDMALSPSGVLHLAGYLPGVNPSYPEVILFRFDSAGAPLDSQASRGEQIRGVAVDAAGNYYLAGRVWSPDRLGHGKPNDLYLGKFSSAGTLLWERALGSSGTEGRRTMEGGQDVTLDASGNILVVGSSSNVATFGDVTFPDTPGGPLLCKFDPDGQLLWAKRVEGRHLVFEGKILASGLANHVALDPEGNIILTGYLYNGATDFGGKVVKVAGRFDSDFFIAKFSPSGEVQWVQTGYGYGGLAVDRQSNIFFNGSANGNSAMHCGALTPAGTVLWERKIPRAFGVGVALTAAGDPVFVGEFEGTLDLDGHTIEAVADTNQKLFIASASADGQFRWVIGDSGQTMSRALRVMTSDGGRIFVAGDVRCGDSLCEPGQLGSFALSPVGVDLFLARIDDPTTPATELKIAATGSEIRLSWPVSATGLTLESADAVLAPDWTVVPPLPVVEGDQYIVTLATASSARFFRLRKP
jgi:outer membrane protein assembly factor BamB